MLRTLMFLVACLPVLLSAQIPDTADTVRVDALFMDTMTAEAFVPTAGPLDLQLTEVRPGDARRRVYPGGWFFLLNLALLIILAVRQVIYPHYTRKSWNAFVNENLFFQLTREKTPIGLPVMLVEYLLKLYVYSMVVMMAWMLFDPSVDFGAGKLGAVALILAVFFVLKSLAAGLLAAITDTLDLYKVMQLNQIVLHAHFSLVLLPLILLVVYLCPEWRYYGQVAVVGLFGIGVIFLIFRALRIVIKIRVPVDLQFFLYLCAFEIMPYLIVARVVESRLMG